LKNLFLFLSIGRERDDKKVTIKKYDGFGKGGQNYCQSERAA
jgi:hypothetical protein